MRINIYFSIALMTIILFLSACSRSFILLSPEDLYALGNYYLDENKFREAGDQFEQIRNEYPTSQFATMSQFKLALTEYEKGNYEEAAVEFKLFLEFHPAHKMAPQAKYFLAFSKFHSISSPERDITMALEAKKELSEFLARYPDHPDSEKVKINLNHVIDHLQSHEIQVARVYYRRRSYDAALLRLEPVLETEASAIIKQSALLLIAKAYAKKDDYEQSRKYFQEVIDNGADEKTTQEAKKHLSKLKN